jgi:hypothetical protein
MPLTIDDINELQFSILDAILASKDEAIKNKLRSELEYYQRQKADIISSNNAARIEMLKPRVEALERIVRQLQNETLKMLIGSFRRKAGLPESSQSDPAPNG